MRELRIELRFDDSNPLAVEAVTEAAKMAAKHIYTSAVLAAGKRSPQIKMYGSDFFTREEEIMLADDIPTVTCEGSETEETI